jgi:hypothetical protein
MSKKKSVSNRPYESDVIKKFERDIEGGLFFNLSTLRSTLISPVSVSTALQWRNEKDRLIILEKFDIDEGKNIATRKKKTGD